MPSKLIKKIKDKKRLGKVIPPGGPKQEMTALKEFMLRDLERSRKRFLAKEEEDLKKEEVEAIRRLREGIPL